VTISVVIPTFNRAHTLRRAIDSVLQQSCKASEIIVVDDGSEDDSVQLLKQHYPQLRILQQSNQGVSSARNSGIRAAHGEWIALLDSDDEWLPHKLHSQIQCLQASTKLRICHTDENWIRRGKPLKQLAKHRKRGGHIYTDCLPLCVISPSSVIIHKSLFDEVGLFDESLPACEDYDLWLRICARYPVGFVEQPCIIKHGGHDDQLSQKYWGMDRFRIIALEKMLQTPYLDDAQKAATARLLVKKCEIFAKGAVKHGRPHEAQQYQDKKNRYLAACH